MRILDEITKEELYDPDLTKGTLYPVIIVKENITPIDNITKYAYEDSDYEDVQLYHTHTEEELNPPPTTDEIVKALLGVETEV